VVGGGGFNTLKLGEVLYIFCCLKSVNSFAFAVYVVLLYLYIYKPQNSVKLNNYRKYLVYGMHV
jgi:hypothetical protein